MPISRFVSAYLDLLRWVTASAVVLYHFQDHQIGPDWLTRYFPSNGNGYVIVFFVISGFVIAMTAERKTLSEFAVDRSIRIYIVAVPVLAITWFLAWLVPEAGSEQFRFAVDHPVLAGLLNLTFLCQSWSLNVAPFLDEPYWSLAYEVFYYLIFGTLIYGSNYKWPLLATLCLLAGPKVLILMPCWIVGVIAYRLRNVSLGRFVSWAAAIILPALISAILWAGLKNWAHDVSKHVIYFQASGSEAFLRSWIVSIAVATHLWGMCRLSSEYSIPMPDCVRSIARNLSGMSYSLYLLHLPIIHMVVYSWGESRSVANILLGIPAAFLLSFLFSRLTEERRYDLIKLVSIRTKSQSRTV